MSPDPLSLLKYYNVNKKQIFFKDGQIIFGELSWPKDVKTNYVKWRSKKDEEIVPRDYYTLETLVFLLENVTLHHPDYVNKAEANDIPFVKRPAKKEVLAYLNGQLTDSENIDKEAEIAIPSLVISR